MRSCGDVCLHFPQSPFAIISFPGLDNPEAAAKSLISRSVLGSAIYELWGSGIDYPSLHQDVRSKSEHLWPQHKQASFRFEIDSFQGKHSTAQQRQIIESFAYTSFEGPIVMKNPENQFVVFEEHDLNVPVPKKLYLGRLVAESGRKAIAKYTLKKRSYIATTSMDAELSLVTANLALAGPGKLAYDPFMGTGSFPLACAHFGAAVFGSDLDGRSIRGKSGRSVKGNFEQYDTSSLYLGGFISDITNTPLRSNTSPRLLDSIICDPPYGVREGLKVLGSTKVALQEVVLLADGTPAHLSGHYIPPKKPYSFVRMLDDILDFSASILVDGGRLCMWMPVAGAPEGTAVENEGGIGDIESKASGPTSEFDGESEEYAIPRHPALELVSECTQHFNKWSRRLLTYRRLKNKDVNNEEMLAYETLRLTVRDSANGVLNGTADDLNAFRRKVSTHLYTNLLTQANSIQYFQGFKSN